MKLVPLTALKQGLRALSAESILKSRAQAQLAHMEARKSEIELYVQTQLTAEHAQDINLEQIVNVLEEHELIEGRMARIQHLVESLFPKEEG